MKVTRQQAEKNRERVLEVAGRVFREKGFDGVGVADLMKSALGRQARIINMVKLGRVLNTVEDPPVKALFVYGSNPAANI